MKTRKRSKKIDQNTFNAIHTLSLVMKKKSGRTNTAKIAETIGLSTASVNRVLSVKTWSEFLELRKKEAEEFNLKQQYKHAKEIYNRITAPGRSLESLQEKQATIPVNKKEDILIIMNGVVDSLARIEKLLEGKKIIW